MIKHRTIVRVKFSYGVAQFSTHGFTCTNRVTTKIRDRVLHSDYF